MLCRNVSVKEKKKKKKKSGSVPVHLNVYDLTPMNCYGYWIGIGIFHSGLEVHGVEYAYGAHEQSTSGIFEVEPKKCPGFEFRRSIYVGETHMRAKEVRAYMEKLAEEYQGSNYHLITRNCNHFCNQVCLKLTQKSIPNWVNRLARLGFLFKCVLPSCLSETKVKCVGKDGKLVEGENSKKKLKESKSCTLVSPSSSSKSKSDKSIRSPTTGDLRHLSSSSSCSWEKSTHRGSPVASGSQDQKTPRVSVNT